MPRKGLFSLYFLWLTSISTTCPLLTYFTYWFLLFMPLFTLFSYSKLMLMSLQNWYLCHTTKPKLCQKWSMWLNKILHFLMENTETFFNLTRMTSYIQRSFANKIVPCCNRNQYFKNQMNRIIITYKNCIKKVESSMF